MGEFPQIKRRTIQQQVYEYLKESILLRRIPPQARLNEGEIAHTLGVSPTPVREALKELKGEGLVEVSTDQGIRIISLSIEDIEGILDIRSTLEQLAIREAARHMTQEDLDILQDILDGKIDTSGDSESDGLFSSLPQNIRKMHQINERFHDFFVQKAGNRWLGPILDNLNTLLVYVRMGLTRVSSGEVSRKEHQQILASLKAGDISGAELAMRRHIERVKTQILEMESARSSKESS